MRKLPVVILTVAMAASLAACGSSSSGAKAPSSTSPTSSAPAAAQANGISDPATAKAEITAAYEHAFKTGDPKSTASIETPDKIAAAIKFAAALAKKSPAEYVKVKAITITDAADAKVTYDLYAGGKVELPGAQGTAVFSQGGWKLSDATLCGLLQLATPKHLAGC